MFVAAPDASVNLVTIFIPQSRPHHARDSRSVNSRVSTLPMVRSSPSGARYARRWNNDHQSTTFPICVIIESVVISATILLQPLISVNIMLSLLIAPMLIYPENIWSLTNSSAIESVIGMHYRYDLPVSNWFPCDLFRDWVRSNSLGHWRLNSACNYLQFQWPCDLSGHLDCLCLCHWVCDRSVEVSLPTYRCRSGESRHTHRRGQGLDPTCWVPVADSPPLRTFCAWFWLSWCQWFIK